MQAWTHKQMKISVGVLLSIKWRNNTTTLDITCSPRHTKLMRTPRIIPSNFVHFLLVIFDNIPCFCSSTYSCPEADHISSVNIIFIFIGLFYQIFLTKRKNKMVKIASLEIEFQWWKWGTNSRNFLSDFSKKWHSFLAKSVLSMFFTFILYITGCIRFFDNIYDYLIQNDIKNDKK